MRKFRGHWLFPFVVVGALLSGATDPQAEQLQRHRNLGKAFYENPTTQKEAVAEFKAALDLAPASVPDTLNYGLALLRAARPEEGVAALQEVQRVDPSLPHTWFNLGIYYKNAGDLGKAAAQFAQFVKLVPVEPIGHYQMGAVDRADGRIPEAIAQFEQAEKLDPQLAAAHFQLYNLYRQSGRSEEAAQQLKEFQRLKQEQEGAAIKEDVEWCNYAEIYDPPRQVSAIAPNPKPVYDDRALEGTVDAGTSGILPIDSEGTGIMPLVGLCRDELQFSLL
jgi:tetratricopeptide (TPR) repeat protein